MPDLRLPSSETPGHENPGVFKLVVFRLTLARLEQAHTLCQVVRMSCILPSKPIVAIHFQWKIEQTPGLERSKICLVTFQLL
jgi:hypothetical protein